MRCVSLGAGRLQRAPLEGGRVRVARPTLTHETMGSESGPRHRNRNRSSSPSVLAYMGFPAQHRAKLHSTNSLERLNGEIKRRSDVVGIFPNEAAVERLIGALLLEQHEEWSVQRARYMTLETIAPLSDDPLVSPPALAA